MDGDLEIYEDRMQKAWAELRPLELSDNESEPRNQIWLTDGLLDGEEDSDVDERIAAASAASAPDMPLLFELTDVLLDGEEDSDVDERIAAAFAAALPDMPLSSEYI